MSAQEVAHSVLRPFTGPVLPELPIGSPERAEVFREFRRTFLDDWREAEEAVAEANRAAMGDLYFVAAGNAIKIGRTTDFAARLRYIQGHNHEQVTCLLLASGQGWREKGLHQRFRKHRLHGEWFERCPDIEAEIERLRA